MKNENMKKNNKGFSLVELIVVIAIMAVLMVILAPAMLRYVEKTRVQKDESAISEAANAAELALGDETIYDAAGNADVYVYVKDNTDISDNVAGGVVAKDVKNTVGDKIEFVSKAYDGATATIHLEFNTTKQAYVLVSDTTTKKPFTYTTN